MVRVESLNWEWCVRMCISETGLLVVSAPRMAAPLDAGRDTMLTIHLSAVEGGVLPSDIAPACSCSDARIFPAHDSLNEQIFVSGSFVVPEIASACGPGSVPMDGNLSVHTLDLPVEKSDLTRSDSEVEAGIVSEIQFILRMRRARTEFFEDNLFAEPAWDMMLDLMEARLRGTEILTSSLCMAASVPATTALRWIKNLTEKGILVRRADENDKRRVYVALSDEAASAMKYWFELFHRQ